ncbi:MAG TPA: site-specific integrase [Stellaceae bacterium]|nr:site-specific integrase [Stellaceae bacterium]
MRQKLTKTTVDGIEPSGKRIFVWDTELRGFGLRVTPSGAKTYVLQYRMGGRGSPARRYTIGQHGKDGWTPETARKKAEELKRLAKGGTDPHAAKIAERSAQTLKEFSEHYIEAHARKHKRERSVEEDERNLNRHILPTLGDRKLSSLTAKDIAKFHTGMGATPTTANRCLALLSHMLTFARKQGIVSFAVNPCRDIDKFPETARKRYLSQAEFARLGTVLTEADNAWEHHQAAMTRWRERGKKGKPPEKSRIAEHPTAIAIIRLLILTGCRLSEIVTLQHQQIDIAERRLRLTETKTGPKIVPLATTAVEILTALKKPEETGNLYALPGQRKGRPFGGIQRVWQRIRERARLHDVRLHDLRHSFASAAVAGGTSLFITGKLLGHTQARTTERYAHVATDPLLEAADKTAARIADAMARKTTADEARGDVQRMPRREK